MRRRDLATTRDTHAPSPSHTPLPHRCRREGVIHPDRPPHAVEYRGRALGLELHGAATAAMADTQGVLTHEGCVVGVKFRSKYRVAS